MTVSYGDILARIIMQLPFSQNELYSQNKQIAPIFYPHLSGPFVLAGCLMFQRHKCFQRQCIFFTFPWSKTVKVTKVFHGRLENGQRFMKIFLIFDISRILHFKDTLIDFFS